MSIPPFLVGAVRLAAKAAHKLLKVKWFFHRPKTIGAHAVALTPAGKLVLVKLRYAPGWRLPGGGMKPEEHPIDAALRELREEIAMTAHGSTNLACELEESIDFRRDASSLVIVRDVQYRPTKWNWEVEEVREAALDELPADLSPQVVRWLKAVSPYL